MLNEIPNAYFRGYARSSVPHCIPRRRNRRHSRRGGGRRRRECGGCCGVDRPGGRESHRSSASCYSQADTLQRQAISPSSPSSSSSSSRRVSDSCVAQQEARVADDASGGELGERDLAHAGAHLDDDGVIGGSPCCSTRTASSWSRGYEGRGAVHAGRWPRRVHSIRSMARLRLRVLRRLLE